MAQHNLELVASKDGNDDHIDIKIEENPAYLEIKQEGEPVTNVNNSNIYSSFSITPIRLTNNQHGL